MRLAKNVPVLGLLLFLAGCYTVEEPPCPPIEIPENQGECSSLCNCADKDFAGTVFRLTRMEIDEPEELAALLNLMWSTDILNNIVNVLFLVEDFEPGTAAAFDRITFRVGPGWRYPNDPLTRIPEEGQPSESAVESYCLLEGMDVAMDAVPYHGNQCVFKSAEASALHFHTGPLDRPIVCAPQVEPPNAIPIQNLKVRFGFHEQCDGFSDGHLEGCISVTDADKICLCMATGTCDFAPVDVGEYEPDDLTAYCKDQCGLKWISFGSSVRAFGLTPTCLTLNGEPGYRLQGFIDAVEVTDVYNPVQSANCSVPPGSDL